MWDCPRKMVALNTEERGILKMNVLVRMVTTHMVKEDQFDQYYQSDNCQQKLVSLQYWMFELFFKFYQSMFKLFGEFHNETVFKTLLYEMSSYFLSMYQLPILLFLSILSTWDNVNIEWTIHIIYEKLHVCNVMDVEVLIIEFTKQNSHVIEIVELCYFSL